MIKEEESNLLKILNKKEMYINIGTHVTDHDTIEIKNNLMN